MYKFRAISGSAWKMHSLTPPKSAKVKLSAFFLNPACCLKNCDRDKKTSFSTVSAKIRHSWLGPNTLSIDASVLGRKRGFFVLVADAITRMTIALREHYPRLILQEITEERVHDKSSIARRLPDATPAYPVVRKIGPADLKDALAKGVNDFLPFLDFLVSRYSSFRSALYMRSSPYASLAVVCSCSFRSCRVSLWLALSRRLACTR